MTARDMTFRPTLGLALLALAPGCGGLRQAVSYSGESSPPRRSADQIGYQVSLPPDFEAMGSASASCTHTEGRRAIHHEWLGDVDCSEERLTRALAEEAAEQGADILIERRCDEQVQSIYEGQRRLLKRCSARVARRQEPLAVQVPARPVSEPKVGEDWRICVDFWPAGAVRRGPPLRSDLVREVTDMPVSHVAIGAIKTHCRRGCSEQAAHDGVRAAAGSLGATDVVGVQCVARSRGYECTGTAAQAEVDPRTEPRAR